jgi:phosphoribosylanthranilate isomerase
MQVKICGITSLQDALCAAENGAAAVGFVFYPPSPRFIEPQKAAEISKALPARLVRVGVFVNAEEPCVWRTFEDCRLDMIQLHGDESPAYCRQFPKNRIIKAMTLKTDDDVRRAGDFDAAAILVDARHAGLYGGTGKTVRWDLAGKIAGPLILSGGLNESNVLSALQKVRPAALDINSSVEERPGKKDAIKIKNIMQLIKNETDDNPSPPIFIRREEK